MLLTQLFFQNQKQECLITFSVYQITYNKSSQVGIELVVTGGINCPVTGELNYNQIVMLGLLGLSRESCT